LQLISEHFGDVDINTGFPYDYEYNGMIELDGKNYYSFRMNWIVDVGTDTAHSSYLTDLVVSEDLSYVGENYNGVISDIK
jgi:hypothetical protein